MRARTMLIDEKPLLVVMDTNVIIHQLHDEALATFGDVGTVSGVKGEELRGHLYNWVNVQMAWVQSANWMPLALHTRPTSMVWAMDCYKKNYWRTEYLASDKVTNALPVKQRGKNKGKQVPIVYKGGRRRPSRTFELIRDQVLVTILNSECPMLYKDGYEADDQIATITVVNDMLSQPYNIIIATVDNDLLGLVRDAVGWVCTAGWEPRVRLDVEGVNKWRRGKKYQEVTKASEIWLEKAYNEGDTSDNIPPVPTGETLCAIDLLNPPEEHRLWLYDDVFKKCASVLRTHYEVDRAKGYRALGELTSRGCSPVIRSLPTLM